MKHGCKNYRLPVALLILALTASPAMPFSKKLTASITTDTLRPIDPKPIRFSEEGARQALKDRADVLYLYGVVASQDTLLRQNRQTIEQQQKLLNALNSQQQHFHNALTAQQTQTDRYRRKLKNARLENWLVRSAAVLYVAYRLRLLNVFGF